MLRDLLPRLAAVAEMVDRNTAAAQAHLEKLHAKDSPLGVRTEKMRRSRCRGGGRGAVQ